MITLLAYIGLFYAFLGDYLIFKERLSVMEIVGIGTILVINVALVVMNMRKKKAAPATPSELK